jgi:hypothetical protein
MSDPDAIIEHLRRSNRRWRALALASCAAIVLAGLVAFLSMTSQRIRAEAAMRDVKAALARANMDAPNPGQPR